MALRDGDDDDEGTVVATPLATDAELEQITAMLSAAATAIGRKWQTQPQHVMAIVAGIVAVVFYLKRVSPLTFGVWCFIASALCTIAYLRLRSKAFELTPIMLLDRTAGDLADAKDSSAVHSASRKLSRRWEVCSICLKQVCDCSSDTQASSVVENDVLVSPQVNHNLTNIFRMVVEQHVMTWYSLYSTDPECVVEIQMLMRDVLCSLARRLHDTDVATLVRAAVLPAVLNHIEAYLIAEKHGKKGGGDDAVSVHRRALAMYKDKVHAAFSSEERYYRTVFTRLWGIPGVLDRGKSKCPSLKLFLAQSLFAAIRPTLASAAQPRAINSALAAALQRAEGTSATLPRRRHSGSTYEPMCTFVPVAAPRASVFNVESHTVLADAELKMQFNVFATRVGLIDTVVLYSRLEDMMGTLHAAIDAETMPKFHEYAVKITALVGVLPVCPIVTKSYCGAIRRIAETPLGSLSIKECSKRPFEDMWKDVQTTVHEEVIPAFLRSKEYFDKLLARTEPVTARARGHTEKAKPKKSARRREAEIQAEIELLNLPPPPSAVEEEHPHLVAADGQVKKRKNIFRRKTTSDKKDGGKTPAIRSTATSAATSPAVSPTARRRADTVGVAPSVRARTETLGARPLSANFDDAVGDDVLEHFAQSAGSGSHKAEDDSALSPDAPGAAAPAEAGAAVEMKLTAPVKNDDGPRYDVTGVRTAIAKYSKMHQGSRQFVVYVISVSQQADGGQQQGEDGAVVLSTGNTWEVDRRYSDFATLEKKLKRLYPEFDLATLPDKKRFGNLETKHLENRRGLLDNYLSSLVENPLIHNDQRCTDIVHKFLDPKCDFKEEMKNHVFRKGGGRAPQIRSLLSKKDKDWSSFTSLFTVTLDDVEESTAAAYAAEVQIWTKLREELDAAKIAPDAPVYEVPDAQALQAMVPAKECFTDNEVDIARSSLATRVVGVFGMMCGRLQHGWVLQAMLGLGKLVFGGSIDANLDVACERAAKLDESTLLEALEGVRASLESAAAAKKAADGAGAHPEAAAAPAPEDDLSDEDVLKQVKQAVAEAIPMAVRKVFGEAEVKGLASSLVDVFQDEVYNKQLVYVVVDAVIAAMFPELEGVPP